MEKDFNELTEKLASLAKNERELTAVNLKIAEVLDLKNEADQDYEMLSSDKEKIMQCYANKKRKSICLEKIALLVTTVLLFLLTGAAFADLAKMLPHVVQVIYSVLCGVVLGYEVYLGVKDLNRDEKIYEDLDYDLEYVEVLKKLDEKEREINLLNSKYKDLLEKNTVLEISRINLRKLITTLANDMGRPLDLSVFDNVYLNYNASPETAKVRRRTLN